MTIKDTLHVSGIPYSVDEGQLQTFFEAYGDIAFVKIIRFTDSGRSRGYGFVSFKDPQDAELAVNHADREQIGDRYIQVNWSSRNSVGEEQEVNDG